MKGYITGYADGTFRGENPITRTEFLKLIFLVKGVEISHDNMDYFLDIGSTSWQKKYVNTALHLGLITKANKKFYPNSFLTKVEALKMAVLLFVGEIQSVYSQELMDVGGSEWFAKYVQYSIENNLLPVINNYFYPNKNITRYEVIRLLFQLSNS